MRSEKASGDRAYYRKRTPGGGWGPPVEIFNKGEWGRLAWSPSGQMAAAWHYDTDGNSNAQWFEIFVKFSDDGGQTWTTPYNVSQRTALDRCPEITYAANGDFHIVWQGFGCDGCRPEVLHKARIGGNWTWEENISNSAAGRSGTGHNAIQARGSILYITYTDTDPDFYEDVLITTTGPQIQYSPASLSRSVQIGWTVPDETFTVRNGGVGTLHYTITPDAPWLVCQPASGQSAGETDTIALSYPGVNVLSAGSYIGNITIASPDPGTAPAKLSVALTVTAVKPDFDRDGDVDMDDFGRFQVCLSGATIPQTDPACQNALMDADADVDAQDLAVFQQCLTSSKAIAPLNCDK